MADSSGGDEYDIQGLDPEDAKKYIVAVMATLKQTAAKRVQLEHDLEMWEGRVKLAIDNGRQDLVEGAQRRVEQIKEDIEHMRGEEQEYTEGLSRMKSQLRTLQTQPQMSVDVDLLNAQLEMILGEEAQERAETDDKFRDAQADWALNDLKRKLHDEDE